MEVTSIERPERVVKEIRAIEADLQFLRLFNLEVLEESQVGVEEGRSVNRRKHARAVLADARRDGETARVDELVCRQPRGRVAGQDRVELDIIRAQQRNVADVECRARDLVAVETHAEVLTLYPCQVRAALELRNTRELPTVYEAAGNLIVVDWVA